MPINSKVKEMHSLLQKAGADVGDVTEFNNWFFAKGDEGYKNRKSVFDTFKNAGADVGDTYEDFAGSLGLQAVKPGQTNLSRFDEESVNQTLDKAQQAISQAKQGANRILNREQRIGLDVPKGAFGRINLGENRKVTPGIDRFNFNKGQMEQTYITEAGNEYGNRGMADLEQNIVDDARRREQDPFGTQMGDAYSEQRNLQGRIEELEAKRNAALKEDNGFVYHDKNLFSDEEDQELQNLKAAQRQNDQRILTMEREKEDYEAHGVFETLGKWGSDFVKGMYDTARNPSVYSFGVTDLGDMTQLYKVKKKIEAANEAGVEPELTESEKSLLQNTMLNNYTQSEYGKNRSDMYDWGQIAMQAIPFVAEFWLTGGMKALSDLGAKYGTKAAAKMALDGWKAKVVKNTGVALGDLAAGFAMANTTGAAKTAAEILDRNIGDIDVDENGNYVFNNGESLAEAVYKGTLKQTFEYYTEKLGDHTNFSKYLAKGAEKFGLSKLSKAISFLSGSKGLKALGVHDYPSEVFEEEANLLLGATFGLDQNFSIAPLKAASNDIFGTTFQVDRNSKEYQESMFNGKTQKDIVFGMFFSLGVLNAARYAQTGYTAAQYKRFQHNVNNADAEASTIFGANNWQMIKEQIDACDNQDMAQLMQSVADGGMTTEQKAATAKYAANLMKMRGYNATLMSLLNVEEEKTSPKAQASNAVNKSYSEGYDAQEPTLRKQYNDETIAAEQNLPQYGDEFAKMVSESETPVETLDYLMQNRDYYTDEQIGAAADYFTKKSRAEGMMDGALDQVDTQVEKAKANVRSNTHQQTGSVITAQYDGREYYVVGGDVVTDPETGTPMLAGTGGAVVVKDAETGETSVMNPNDLTMGTMQSADELIQVAETDYRQQLMQQAEDDINYGAPANETYQLEDTVALSDGEGNVIEGQIGMMPNSIDGAYVVYTTDGKALQLTADEMNRRIVAHNGVEVQRESPQQITENGSNSQLNGENLTENAENGQNYAQNQPENIPNSGNLDNAAGENAPAEDGGQESNQQQSALSRIPVKVDEKGNPFTNKKGKPILDWHKASVEDAAEALVETTGGNMLMARDTASDLIKQGQAKLEKIRKQQPKGEDPIEMAESRMEIQRQIEEQQAINKQWQDVSQLIQKQMRDEQQRIETEREAAKSAEQKAREAEEKRQLEEKRRAIDEERRRKKVEDEIANWNKPYAPLAKARKELAGDPDALAILDDTEPRSLEEWISTLIRPKSMMWDDEEIGGRTVTGLQSELGLQKKDIERIGSLVAPSSKGGKPFGQVVHDIWENLPEGMKNLYTDQDVRNTLIGMFGSYDAFTMRHLSEENRIQEAREMVSENVRREVEAEMEAWAEFYHLNPEEREAYNEWIAQAPTEPEEEIINNIIYDKSYSRNLKEGTEPVSGGNAPGTTGGESQVQQAAETADNGNNEERIAQGAEAEGSEPTATDNNVSGSEGGVIPRPEVDIPRFKALRQNLIDAYSALMDAGGRDQEDAKAVAAAAKEIQRYVDEGLDSYSPNEQEYYDEVTEYDGDDAEKLADQYITRVFLDRYCDDDEDKLYILHGLKPSMREKHKLLSHNGKQFKVNDFGVCTNPNVIAQHSDKKRSYIGWEIETALSERGWVGAPKVDYATGGWSGPVTAGWNDKYFETEEECQAYWAQRIIDYLTKGDGKSDKNMGKYIAGLQNLINNAKKPAAKPAPSAVIAEDEGTSEKAPSGKVFNFDENGVCQDPNPMQIGGDKFNFTVSTAYNGKGWVGSSLISDRLSFAKPADINKNDTPVFDTESECRAHYAQQAIDELKQSYDGKQETRLIKALRNMVSEAKGADAIANEEQSFIADLNKLISDYDTGDNGYLTEKDLIDQARSLYEDNLPKESAISKRLDDAFAEYDDMQDAYYNENGQRDDDGSDAMIETLRDIVAAKPAKVEAPKKKRNPKDEDFSGLNQGVRLITPDGTIEIYSVDYDKLSVYDIDENGNRSVGTRKVDTVDIADGLKNGTIKPAEPKKPKLDKKDYRTYMTPEAKAYFADKYANYAHPEIAYIEGAVRDKVIIPVEELKQIPEIVEAERRVKEAESKEPLTLPNDKVEELANRLIDNEHGSAVFEDDTIRSVDGHDDFSGPVKQERKAFVVIGRPAGGKSSVFANSLSNQHGARIIDSDVVKEWLPGYDEGYGAGYVQNMSSEIADKALDMAVKAGDNIVLPRIGGASVVRMSVALRLMGYDVQLFYNDVVPETSYMRSQSRFAKTGRFLSLDYLTTIGDKPSKIFSKFAEKSIGDYLDECTEEEVQKLRGRIESLAGGEQSNLQREISWWLEQEGRGNGDGRVSADVERSRAEGAARSVDFAAPIFSYSEWKSNDVSFGEKPKEIWNSNNGKSLSETLNDNNDAELRRRGLHEKRGEASQEAGQTSGRAEPSRTGSSAKDDRNLSAGSASSVKQHNRLVSDDKMDELKKRLIEKLGGQLNAGIDPELMIIGGTYAVGKIERGFTKFVDYATEMVNELGDFIRPYLKAFYETVRQMPGSEEYRDQMDSQEYVNNFDVLNFDKGAKVANPIEKAEHVVKEQKIKKQAKKIKQEKPDLFAGDLFADMLEPAAQPIGKTSTKKEIKAEEAKVDTNPTEAQKEAGNYQKGHIWVDGHDVTIENPKGSVRRGTDANGKAWEITMNNTYGYIRGTEGVDGDHIDVFLSDNPAWGAVFVVDQVNPDGSFDEHKVMYGFPNEEAARKAYLSNYSKGWKGLGTITEVSREDFKKWISSSHRKTKPFADYKMENNPWFYATKGEDGTLMRRAIDKDLDNNDVHFYYNGKPAHIMLVTRSGEQVSSTKFSEPKVESVTLTNGKSVKLNDLWVKVDPIVELHETYKSNLSENGRVSFNDVRTNANTGEVEYVGRMWEYASANRVDFAIKEKDLQTNLDNGTYEKVDEKPAEEPAEVKKEVKPKAKPAPMNNNQRNNVGERGVDYAPGTLKARFNANVEAIKLMRQLIDDGVEDPTKEQKEILRKYSGWGGMGTFFNDESSAENKELRDLLSDEEYNDAAMSINSAYYTPAMVIDSLWDIADAMGFKGGNVLEGSAGIGNIIGQMPKDMSRRSNIEAVEIDSISGNILKLLYPDAKVHIQGFQDTMIPNGSVDLAITNVPFVTGLHVIDKVDKDLSRKFKNIHDFCIAKNIRKLREGGIGLFITSSGTLDKSTDLRAWITDEGQTDVIGAFRLNNETFKGTTVTSDIIVVRKRTNNQKSPSAIDISAASPMRVGSYEDKYGTEHQVSMVVNDYFKQHPEMMAGEMAFAYEKGDTFRPGSYGLYPVDSKDQEKMLNDFSKSMSKAKEIVTEPKQDVLEEPDQLTTIKEGRMLLDDKGRLCVSRMGTAEPLQLNDNKIKGKYTKEECFKDYQTVQKAVDDVLQQQLSSPDDAALKPKMAALNKAFDNFVKKYGELYKNTAISFLRNDIDYPSFQALVDYKVTKDMKGKETVSQVKMPIFFERVLGFKTEPKPKTVKDALIASIFMNNGIDLKWIAEKLNDAGVKTPDNGQWTEDDVKNGIIVSRLGFEDPSTGQMVVYYKYLSGNVREKLSIAESYNTDGKYNTNVEELRKVVPMDIPAHLIDFSLGSSWIPMELYQDYLKENFDVEGKLTKVEGSWSLADNWYRNEKNRAAGVYSKQFRETIYGHQIVMAAFNNSPIKVQKQEKVGWGRDASTRTVTDKEATQACAVRMDEIKDEFRQWVKGKIQENPELSQRLEKIYNEKFNALVPMNVDEEFMPEQFEGANINIHLYDYQRAGVLRGLTAPTMLAHVVGAGKSFTMITTAMEMRRLGTARKPMLVVQNATVAQMAADAKLLYPNAKVLSLQEKDRDAEGRRAFYASIKYNDWDLIIIPQSTFERIPDSPERELQFIQEKIDEKKHVIEAARAAGADSKAMRKLEKELKKIEQEYGDKYLDSDPANGGKPQKRKKKDAKREAAAMDKAETRAKEMLDRATDDVQNFDDLGVDALLVDEAHEYKHLGFQTSIERGIKGVDPSYSKKCAGLYNKTRSIFEKSGWKNVVFATGTPISNTAAEIWTFMKYLMPADVMQQNDIYYFDDFVHNFGAITQMLEFATSGKFKENTRFAAYMNRPELIRIWMQVAHIVNKSDLGTVADKLPKKENGKDQDVFLPQSPSLVNIMAAVRAELERYENMSGKEKKENSHIPLTMYGVAKRAAIDPRLVNADAIDEPMSKTNAAVKEIVKDLKATKDYKGTVAVFCDNQNRKADDGSVAFNIYEDMKQKLIKAGVPEKQIAIIKSGMSIPAKQKVFDAVNAGDIRVVLGSTQTLGTGVNMQERLHLLIHMDAPDRPMDYTQRNGRIERQGNLHKDWGKPIRIIRFGVEDSLDVTAYQRLKTKSGFIDSIMDGKSALANNQVDRTVEEEEEGLFDNPVAVLSGSQYAMLKNKAERELRKYQSKKAQWEADQIYINNALRQYASLNQDAEEKIKAEEKDMADMKRMFPDGKVKTINVEGTDVDMTKGDEAVGQLSKAIKEKINDPVNAIVKRNRENPIYNDEALHFKVEFDGHPVDFTVNVSRSSEWDGGKMKTVIHKYSSYNSPELKLKELSSTKSVRDHIDEILDTYILGIDYQDRIDAMKAGIERRNTEMAQMKEREGKPFEFSKELEDAQKQVDEYTELMKKEMEEKEAKYASQQTEAVDLSKAEENGDDENLYRMADEDEDTFKSFFGDWKNDPDNASKVVGENGQPLIVYRGGKPLDSIDNASSNAMYGKAFYATPSIGGAEEYAIERTGDKNNVQAVYVNVRKPFVDGYVDGFNHPKPASDEEIETLVNALAKKGLKEPKYFLYKLNIGKIHGSILGHLAGEEFEGIERPVGMFWPAADIVQETLKELGYDGVIGMYSGEAFRMPQVAAFDMSQVRESDTTMFREQDQFIEGQLFPIDKQTMQSSFNVLGQRSMYSTTLLSDSYPSEAQLLDAVRMQYPAYYATIEDGNIKMQSWRTVMAEAKEAQTIKGTKGTESYVERKTRQAIDAVNDMASRMHLNVEVLTDTNRLTDKQKRAKGWFNPKTHKIVIVLPNHTNVSDVINTLLHEGVAHYGLRNMFGQNFETFLDNVYNNADEEIRSAIDASIKKKGWSRHEATEEYLARLAERTDFEHAQESGWWQKIKQFFLDMLAKVGFDTTLSDNDLRYILWRSYDNLLHPDSRRDIFDKAREVQMQSRLKVGNYAEQPYRPAAELRQAAEAMVSEPVDNEYSTVEDAQAYFDKMAEKYNSVAPISVVSRDMSDREMAERIFYKPLVDTKSDEDIAETMANLRKTFLKRSGGYIDELGKIVIFADALKTSRFEEAFFHENIHAALDKKYGENLRDVADKFWENTPDEVNGVSKEWVEEKYKNYPEYIKEEFFTYVLGKAMVAGNLAEVDKYADVEEILNEIGYDRRRENEERRSRLAETERGKAESAGGLLRRRDEIEDIISKAKADGTYMLAPNGKPTNLSEDQWSMVRTKAFKNWFGDWENDPENASKVVDENGEPKVMYHGTKLRNIGLTEPFWEFYEYSHFGTKGQADGVAKDIWGNANPYIYQVFLNIRNPQRRKDADQDYLEEKGFSMSEFWYQAVERAENKGHDGIVYLNEYEDKEHPADSWIAFKPNQVKSATDNNGEFSTENDDIRYSMRTKPAPKKTGTGYKVFVLKDGQLYPPMVANPGGEGTPIGMWLDADAAPIAGASKTGRPQVKAGGKGTQGGSGQLAYRPGWHLGTIPYALQFNRKDKNGEKTLFPNNFVWAEVEYADDVDYNDEAYRAGVNENGKYQHSLAGLKYVPTDGSYMYRTNPNPETDPWIITGAMKVKKILSREEVDKLVRDAGREPQKLQEGDVLDQQALDELNAEIKANERADEMGLLYRDDSDIAQEEYNKEVAKKSVQFQESWQDSMVGLKAIQDAIAKETGNVATGAEDAYRFENRMHGRAKNMTEQYDWRFYRPMLKAFSDFCKSHDLTQQQGIEYLISKSGLERNVYYAFRNAMKQKVADDVSAERDKLEKDYAKGRIPEAHYKKMKEALEEKQRTGVDDEMQKVKELLVYKRAKEEYENGNINFTEYLRRIEQVIAAHTSGYYGDYAHDYSGLTETFAKDMYDAAQEVKKEAQRTIDPTEKRKLWSEYNAMMRDAYNEARMFAEDAVFAGETNIEETNKLWNAINAATKETLKTSYESGLIDRKGYDKVRDMFDYYIPLRGWDEDKASDVYTYMGKDNVFSPAVKKTWGRTSKAENPLAYIGNIAVSTILSGHRNHLKQHFLNYVMNNPTSLVSISESWYENIGTEENPMWIMRSADTAGKSADEIAQIVNDFNDEMKQKQAAGLAMPVTGRLRLDVNATQGQKSEHVVEVQRAGHTYQLYINGDPKAAQALNGTNVRSVSRISDTYLGKLVTKLNRSMAMFFTSKNPAFVVSNLSRDLNMAGASVAINEGAAYNAQFIANVAKVLTPRLAAGDFSREGIKAVTGKGKGVTGMMPKLLAKWKNGKLNERNEVERYFKEFMDEGGETGFVNMLSVDSFKEKMKKEIKEMNGSSLLGDHVKETYIGKGLRLLGDTFEFYNRCAEDATRFIVYMTSRQMGKSLEDSIADAKDVTLNFNRKGTGDKGNAEVRDLFIFVNPAIQALANMYRMSTGHTLKFGAVTAAFVAGGAMMAILNQWMLNMWGDDDDKDAYWNLPPWVRKNNFVMWIPGTKNFVTIPLAQEFRVFYGVGEMIASASLDHPVHNPGLEVFSSVADLIPINPTGNGGSLMVDFAPTMIQPLMQVGENVDFTGKPIWKENQGNKYAPAYTKAYISTPTYMVKIAEALNTATGGNEGKQGVVEQYSPVWGNYINNPAVWNHLLQGYFGGMYNTIAKGFDVITTAASGEMPKVYQTPVINRFLNRPVERDNAGALGEEYYKLIEDRDRLKYELRTWKKKAADGEDGAQEHIDEILESPEWKQIEVIDHYDKIMKDLRAGEKAASNSADKGDIKETISMYKQQMEEELHAISEDKDPLDAAVEQFGKAKTFAEKNKLRMRIERLTMEKEGAKKDNAKSRNEEVEKALQYITDEERESRDVNDRYLQLATPENIRNDARIKSAKAKIKKYTDEYKKMIADGRQADAAQYRTKNQKWFAADQIVGSQSRTMQNNKTLLGKGHDAAIMKIIDSNRRSILKAIEKIEE